MEPRLDSGDLVRVLDAVRALHGALGAAAFRQRLVETVADLVRCDSVSYNEVDPSRGLAMAVTSPDPLPVHPGRDLGSLLEAFARLAHEHPVIRYVSRTGDGSARTIADHWSRSEFHRSRLYREVYRWLDVEHQLSVTLPTVRPRVIGIALNRSGSRRPFDGRDRAVLNLMRPHLVQAYQRTVDAERIAQLLAGSRGALAASGASVVLVTAGPPVELTEGALVELFRYFGRPSPSDPLPERVRRWMELQRGTTVAGGAADPRGLLSPSRSEVAGVTATVRLLPTGDVTALIITTERTASASLAPLGLSRRETEVLRLVARGLTNEGIGRRMGIAPATVKKHLEHCYRKLGVGSRAAAVALAADILAHDAARSADPVLRPDRGDGPIR